MSSKDGGKLFRLNEIELRKLEKKTREINKRLLDNNRNAMTDTEVLHEILKTAINSTTLDDDLKIILEIRELTY